MARVRLLDGQSATVAPPRRRWHRDLVGRRRKSSGLEGVLVVDKPPGVTSHDVVQRVRRRLREPRVGHAGTLDPMATGVLVVMVGEATKLARFLTADDKSYLAEVQLGRSTDTLDAEGETEREAPLPAWWTDAEAEERIAEALAAERERRLQEPPVYSAIKVDGRSAHARVRSGEAVALAERPVAVRTLALEARDVEGGRLTLNMTVSKGYYVRALARDLGERLGIPCHLSALRRTASGVFSVEEAVTVDDDALAERLVAVAEAAARALPTARLTAEGTTRARHGGPMSAHDFERAPGGEGASAWLDPDGALVAIGRVLEGVPRVTRGFVAPDRA